MDVTPLVKAGTQIIQSYAGGRFMVSGVSYESAIIVRPDVTVSWADAPTALADLIPEHFSALYADRPEVILLGSGKTFQLLHPALRRALKEQCLSVDIMDTGAACRTYNVLMAEGRRVAAALLPV